MQYLSLSCPDVGFEVQRTETFIDIVKPVFFAKVQRTATKDI
jgi:hypothetical protein